MMDRFELRVLVVSGGSFAGLAWIKGLRASPSVRVLLADASTESIGAYACDASFQVPRVDEAEFARALLDLSRREGVRLILPSTDFELPVLAAERPRFRAAGIEVAVSDPRLVAVSRDKVRLHEYLSAASLPVLPRLDVRRSEGLAWPILGKPLAGWGGRGHLVLRGPADLEGRDPDRLHAEYLWQPCLDEFEEFSADFAVGFDGALSPWTIRRRVRTISGFAVITDASDDVEVETVVRRLAVRLQSDGALGVLNAQVLRWRGGLYVTDLNARIGTSALLGNRSGNNLPLFVCASLDPRVRVPRAALPRSPLRMVRTLEEVYIAPLPGPPLSGVVFDLDDTLFRQKHWIRGKLEGVWEAFRDALPARAEFLREGVRLVEELGARRLIDDLVASLGLEAGLRDPMIETYRRVLPDGDFLHADAAPTLERLRRAGRKVALLTDNPPESQRQKIQAAGIEGLFDAIVFTREAGGEKPAEAGFREAARRLGLPAVSLAMVGDNPHRDVLGAVRAGYGAAFWITRPDSLASFDEELLDLPGERFRRIASLRELFWYL